MISIIMPCYNSVNYIDESILSVINQTYKAWELIIVDDCSNDGSDRVILDYCKIDDRIKYLKTDKPSGSPALPRNIGTMKAKGKYIAFLDSDDLWLPNKLEEQMKFFNKENVAVVYSNYEKISEQGERDNRVLIFQKEANYKTLLKNNYIGMSTAIYDVEKSGKVFSISINYCEDYILWLTILKKGFIAINTNTITVFYRIRKGSVSSNILRAIKCRWSIYIDVEKTGYLKGVYYFICYIYYAFLKATK